MQYVLLTNPDVLVAIDSRGLLLFDAENVNYPHVMG